MQISLRQSEIESAVKDYIQKQGINLTDRMVDVVFIAGRGDNGLTTNIDISEASATKVASLAGQAIQRTSGYAEEPQEMPDVPEEAQQQEEKSTSLFG